MKIVTTYRDREQHLRRWLKTYEGFYPVVVEQEGQDPFNKGALLNAFFDYMGKDEDYCAYIDVDYYMSHENMEMLLDEPKNPVHLVGFRKLIGAMHEKNNVPFKPSYPEFFGGAILLSKEQVEAVNGWTNKMKHWSPEDDEIRLRLSKIYEIERRDGYFVALDHARDFNGDAMKIGKDILRNGRDEDDGLSNVKYSITSCEKLDTHTHLVVHLL